MLFGEIVYGPIHSRRLGVSLGMNLMPVDKKLCTFDCVYCECGFNGEAAHPVLPKREEVAAVLEQKLRALQAEGVRPDVITFSGNGEPTLHPDFLGIIEDTCRLRDAFCPSAKVSVLTNSTQLVREEVVRALRLCDNRILKLDSAITATMRLIDQPVNAELTAERIIEMDGGGSHLPDDFLRRAGLRHHDSASQRGNLRYGHPVRLVRMAHLPGDPGQIQPFPDGVPAGFVFANPQMWVEVEIIRIPDLHTGFINTDFDENGTAYKILRDGQVYIIRDGMVYTIMGQRVK